MLDLYYRIWVDSIVFEKTKNGERRNWKFVTMTVISLLQALNLQTLFLILLMFGIRVNRILEISFFHDRKIDSFLSGFINYMLPFLILNYLLIFRNKRYENLINNYEYKNGKLMKSYFIISFILFIGSGILNAI